MDSIVKAHQEKYFNLSCSYHSTDNQETCRDTLLGFFEYLSTNRRLNHGQPRIQFRGRSDNLVILLGLRQRSNVQIILTFTLLCVHEECIFQSERLQNAQSKTFSGLQFGCSSICKIWQYFEREDLGRLRWILLAVNRCKRIFSTGLLSAVTFDPWKIFQFLRISAVD